MKNSNFNILLTSLILAAILSACSPQNNASGALDEASQQLFSSSERSPIPTLHKIEAYSFAAPYSCGGSYELSALFLSDYSKSRNSPELLFNGACNSPLYVEASTAGDDFALISDLGKVSLESVSASKAFNYERTVGSENSFKSSVLVTEGHTYAVLISKQSIRALYVFNVKQISATNQMQISYAVKSYEIQTTRTAAPGFSWEKENK